LIFSGSNGDSVISAGISRLFSAAGQRIAAGGLKKRTRQGGDETANLLMVSGRARKNRIKQPNLQ
jgi:hypothetical protein